MKCEAFAVDAGVSDAHRSEIFREQIRDLYANVPLSTGLAFSGASIMAFLMWSLVHPHEQINVLIWMGSFALLAVVRMVNYCCYLRHESYLEEQDELLEPSWWARVEVLLTVIYGVLFGLFFLLFYDTSNYSLFYQMQMATFLFCMILASASFISSHLPSYIALALGSASLVLVRLVMEADWVHFAMIPVLILFNLFVFNFVERLNLKFKESILARLQNLDLIQALVEKKEQAEEASLEKSKFIAAAGHDLRQPLHAISICAATLGMHVEGEEGNRMLRTIDKSVSALDNMFNTLSYLSRFDSGDIKSQLSHVSLKEIHAQVAEEFEKSAEKKGLAFLVNDDDVYVYTDPDLYGVILRNLLSNAIRFTEVGGIYVDVKKQQHYLEVEISDTGIGIPLDIQTRLFSDDYQLNSPERDRTNGLGLGLALVKRLTSLLSVEMTLQSNLLNGSCFSLRIPIGQKALAARVKAMRYEGDVTGLNILVIDDDVTALTSIESLLKQWGVRVASADSEAKALAIIQQQSFVPDALITDYRLENKKTGIDAIQAVRQCCHCDDLPVLMVTGDRGVDFTQEGFPPGGQVLYKPVSPGAILAFLRESVSPQRAPVAEAMEE